MFELFVVIALAGALYYVTRPPRNVMLRDYSEDVLRVRARQPLRTDLRNAGGRFAKAEGELERIPARW